ncbi:hypothetical protein HU230_0028190 [Bradyrhizobium quebecense]|uniref:Uncharacterized protein n=1 Tax=Bradyrhizobium quebecense TaxID=2748629 RepID=A0A973WHR2_9BRAD|nr:hypothetical protein [Bradyrhizobium quebecense]UGA42167.1 hypothetical protein HU230_0028190 [Bradyrhizobium quebecense]
MHDRAAGKRACSQDQSTAPVELAAAHQDLKSLAAAEGLECEMGRQFRSKIIRK